MAQTPADRRRTAAGRGGLALTLGIVPALFGAILATQQPWTWHRGGWALTVFIAVSAANLLGAVFVAAQAFTMRTERRDPAGAGGATLLTILLLVTLLTGAALAVAHGVPDGAGPVVLALQLLVGAALTGVSAANAKALR